MMDAASYKDSSVSRGLTYHYFALAPREDKPYLLFLHGFPSTSYDWHYQVAYFKEKGYGLVVPDMLGYGDTSKPHDTESYKPSLIARDIIDILDAEKVKQCIVIGHDWGSAATSRLADLYPERFIAVAFLALGYMPPSPDFDLEAILATTKKIVGYELFGYWKLMAAEDSPALFEKNWESLFSILYPDDPSIWKTHIAPTGALRAWIESGQTAPQASWLSEEYKKHQAEVLLKGGFRGPTNWYRVVVNGISGEDEKATLTPRTPAISVPVFFGAALKDAICIAPLQKQITSKVSPDVTVHDFDASHWVMLEKKDEVNTELGSWVESVLSKSKL